MFSHPQCFVCCMALVQIFWLLKCSFIQQRLPHTHKKNPISNSFPSELSQEFMLHLHLLVLLISILSFRTRVIISYISTAYSNLLGISKTGGLWFFFSYLPSLQPSPSFFQHCPRNTYIFPLVLSLIYKPPLLLFCMNFWLSSPCLPLPRLFNQYDRCIYQYFPSSHSPSLSEDISSKPWQNLRVYLFCPYFLIRICFSTAFLPLPLLYHSELAPHTFTILRARLAFKDPFSCLCFYPCTRSYWLLSKELMQSDFPPSLGFS